MFMYTLKIRITMSKKNKVQLKLLVYDVEYNLLNKRVIGTELKTIYIEEKGELNSGNFVLLVSDKIVQNIDELSEIKFDFENNVVQLFPLDVKLKFDTCTKLNIDSKLLYIEEIENSNDIYRITFSSSFISDIKNTKIEIK